MVVVILSLSFCILDGLFVGFSNILLSLASFMFDSHCVYSWNRDSENISQMYEAWFLSHLARFMNASQNLAYLSSILS
jgi:hypothetical protein